MFQVDITPKNIHIWLYKVMLIESNVHLLISSLYFVKIYFFGTGWDERGDEEYPGGAGENLSVGERRGNHYQ